MDEWIVDVISFQKIFGLCGLKCHIVEIWRDVTHVHTRTDGRTECEDRARILETEFATRQSKHCKTLGLNVVPWTLLKEETLGICYADER